MSRIDKPKRIRNEDFDNEYRNLIDRLGFIINTFSEQVENTLNGNVDFNNLRQEIIQYDVTVNACRVPTTNNLIRTNYPNPRGVQVIKAENLNDSNVFPTSAPFLSYAIRNNLLVVKEVTGIQADTKYRLTLLIID